MKIKKLFYVFDVIFFYLRIAIIYVSSEFSATIQFISKFMTKNMSTHGGILSMISYAAGALPKFFSKS